MVSGFLQKLTNAWKMASTMDILEAIYLQGQAESGATVNWRTATQYATAIACARVISEGLCIPPFRLMRKEGRDRVPAVNHPVYDLLYHSPNEFMTAFEFKEMMGLHLAFSGDFFAVINRTGKGVGELLPFEPDMVKIIRDGWNVEYEVTMADGKPYRIPASEMWHVKGPTWTGYTGLEGVKMAREAIGLGIATEKHGSLLFKNGAQTGGLLSTDMPLGKEKADELKKSWQESYSGSNRFKTAVLWGGMKWTSMAMDSDKAQHLETRKFQVEETCRGLRVLPIMVGFTDKAPTYASSEQFYQANQVYTYGSWQGRVEQSANKHLLTPKERKEGYYTKFFSNAFMRGNAKDRSEYYKTMSEIHAMTPNEIRELEDMNPYEGGDEFPVLQGQAAGNDNSNDGNNQV